MDSQKILVIGSSNTDLTVTARRHPMPGETILGDGFVTGQGGKGANQAVAARRLGGRVSFICKTGNDLFGQNAISHYMKEGMDVSHSLRCTAPSGVALVTVGSCGENTIVVVPGANGEFSEADVDAVAQEIRTAAIVLLQLEIPVASVLRIARIAHEAGAYVILNPAPACELPGQLYGYVSLIVPNQTEIQLLTGKNADTVDGLREGVQVLAGRGVKDAVVTLGCKGSLVIEGCNWENHRMVPARKVDAVDTTAAGDTFCGGLCVALAEGRSLEEAAIFATAASSLTVQKLGAQNAIPHRPDVDALL